VHYLYEDIVKLLDKSSQDEFFRRFLDDLGESPQYGNGCYVFPQSGFCLICDKGTFVSAFFHVATEAVRSGDVQSFVGKLPGGIDVTDQRADIEKKLNGSPLRSRLVRGRNEDQEKCYWDDYPYLSFVVTTCLDAASDQIRAVALTSKSGSAPSDLPFYGQPPKMRTGPERRRLTGRRSRHDG